jgi:hypothetical protein
VQKSRFGATCRGSCRENDDRCVLTLSRR